jgi:hypothetical protein
LNIGFYCRFYVLVEESDPVSVFSWCKNIEMIQNPGSAVLGTFQAQISPPRSLRLMAQAWKNSNMERSTRSGSAIKMMARSALAHGLGQMFHFGQKTHSIFTEWKWHFEHKKRIRCARSGKTHWSALTFGISSHFSVGKSHL